MVQELVDGWYEDLEPHYGLNMINQKITFPRDDNFSDDELAFLPYFVYFHALRVSIYPLHFQRLIAIKTRWGDDRRYSDDRYHTDSAS